MSTFADVVTTPCETNPDLFFKPEGEGRFGNRGFGWSPEPAKALCRGCPVLAKCGELILSQPAGDRFGVWAGQLWDGKKTPIRERTEGATK